tara:strand:+ start:109243 stop:109632 length:390 start_codon:yes stop_codon:yes gene_type:complete
MHCLDTSTLISIFDGDEDIVRKLEEISSSSVSITPIILCELYKGAAHANVTEKRLDFIKRLLRAVELLPLSENACSIFGTDYLQLKEKGAIIKDNDLMIASICKAHNATLITRDSKDFGKVKDLKFEVW